MTDTPTGDQSGAPTGEPAASTGGLEAVVRELEAHAATAGWDQAAQLFALVPTGQLVEAEPDLAQALGIDVTTAAPLTPVEQGGLPDDDDIESLLAGIDWPAEVAGCAVVMERLVLPATAEAGAPEDPAEAREYAAQHVERQEVRIVAAAARDGSTYCALRLRAHDEDDAVLGGERLVPGLVDLVSATLTGPPPGADVTDD